MNTLDNAERPNPARGPASNSALTNAINNAGATVQRRRRVRHVSGQLPIVRAATVWPPAMGLKTAPIILDDPCDCGDYHCHRGPWPAPALAAKSARCGVRYQLLLHTPKARRGRRAA